MSKSMDDKDLKLFFTNIVSHKDGAWIAFKVNTAFTPSDQRAGLTERVIKISGQKIEAYWMCMGVGGSETQEAYLIKSAAGNDLISRRSPKRTTCSFI